MTRLPLNREFATRYALVALLFLGMAGWFGYDGLVRYPRADAAALYRSIEKSEPGVTVDLEAFKRQKTQAQCGLMAALLVASAVVGLILLKAVRFRFEYDDEGFVANGVRRSWGDVRSVDRTRWEKKGILVLMLGDAAVVLDAWHHSGVAAVERLVAEKTGKQS